jgi:hypothetical protein
VIFDDPELASRFDLVSAEFRLIESGRGLREECEERGLPFSAALFLSSYFAGAAAGAGLSESESEYLVTTLIDEGISFRVLEALEACPSEDSPGSAS